MKPNRPFAKTNPIPDLPALLPSDAKIAECAQMDFALAAARSMAHSQLTRYIRMHHPTSLARSKPLGIWCLGFGALFSASL